MRNIHKFFAPHPGETLGLALNADSQILTVHEQTGEIAFWVLVDPEKSLVMREFITLPTGAEVPDGATYVGTAHIKWTVWHLFELPR